MSKFSSILVTGGAGFIGSHLVHELLSRGYSVVVLDNFHSGKMENLRKVADFAGFRLVKGDIRDGLAVSEAIRGVDAVVHLGALIDVAESVSDPLGVHDVNVTGSLSVLKAALDVGVKRFVFGSSTAVYGDGNPLPLTEACVLKPISPYAASKVSAEHYCMAFHRCYGLSTVVLRYFNVYGPRHGEISYCGVVTKFVRAALLDQPLIIYGDGDATRDFVYVEDVVGATMLALENDDSCGEAFNVCTGVPTRVNELARIVGEVRGRELKINHAEPRKGDVRDNYGDPSKADEVLGFKAEISLRNGLERFMVNMS